MALAITSIDPVSGSAAGGTEVTVTGTGLASTTAVYVGTAAGTIIGAPTATTVVFRTPPGDVGAQDLTLVDVANDDDTSTTFTYTAAAATPEPLKTTLASKYRLDVSPSGDPAANDDWTKVRGITSQKWSTDKSSEDDTDTDSDQWGLTLETVVNWKGEVTVKRGRGLVTGAYDPGQQVLVNASEDLNEWVYIRYYDRTAVSVADPAWEGWVSVAAAPQGGNRTGDKLDLTLSGQGARTKIDNPVIADPTLKD